VLTRDALSALGRADWDVGFTSIPAGRNAQIADIPGLQNRPEAGVPGAKIKVFEIGPFWSAMRAERGDSLVPSMFQPSGATVVSIDGPRIAALAQFLL
jgi:hypothetical protein